MIAYKFLGTGRVATYSGVRWPEPGTWLETRAGPERCVSGIHALPVEGLIGWIDDELWTCKLGGEIEDAGDVVVAERGRLVDRVQAWNESSAYDFARDCAARGRERVVETLRIDGNEEAAARLDELDSMQFMAAAPDVAGQLPPAAAGLVMMAADTTALAEGRRPAEREPQLRSHLEAVAASRSTYGATVANVAFVLSHWIASLHPDGYEAAFAAERAWQLDRLLDRLGLAVPAP